MRASAVGVDGAVAVHIVGVGVRAALHVVGDVGRVGRVDNPALLVSPVASSTGTP
jgi:hypothetical protein